MYICVHACELSVNSRPCTCVYQHTSLRMHVHVHGSAGRYYDIPRNRRYIRPVVSITAWLMDYRYIAYRDIIVRATTRTQTERNESNVPRVLQCLSQKMAVLVAKAHTSSPVWAYFGFEAAQDGKVRNEELATCRLCARKISTKGRNTNNLFCHLGNHHPTEYNLAKIPARNATSSSTTSSAGSSAAQPTITDTLTLATKYARNSKRWKELTDAVTFYITKDMLPMYTVEKPGFKQLLSTFDSRYQLPSRNNFSRTVIPALYTQVREKMHWQLRHIKFFSATTDL